ncbi:hypothetical protein BDK51DRAFT_37315 [Blyttiomyces helicus]|uniref:Uncharacterized protein n=1 Tax=Blyttiomyces helicus TaxID=388810 RepID=A0A4P9W258_9FUNG|nr:hypothetical protein BDK51DRAFT_37315 [Blyttiomyces helicus]|eukprot:RKO84858.1 hypothetical protein BDK51DRAFT_37315 [Blyttiomyces helicus]
MKATSLAGGKTPFGTLNQPLGALPLYYLSSKRGTDKVVGMSPIDWSSVDGLLPQQDALGSLNDWRHSDSLDAAEIQLQLNPSPLLQELDLAFSEVTWDPTSYIGQLPNDRSLWPSPAAILATSPELFKPIFDLPPIQCPQHPTYELLNETSGYSMKSPQFHGNPPGKSSDLLALHHSGMPLFSETPHPYSLINAPPLLVHQPCRLNMGTRPRAAIYPGPAAHRAVRCLTPVTSVLWSAPACPPTFPLLPRSIPSSSLALTVLSPPPPLSPTSPYLPSEHVLPPSLPAPAVGAGTQELRSRHHHPRHCYRGLLSTPFKQLVNRNNPSLLPLADRLGVDARLIEKAHLDGLAKDVLVDGTESEAAPVEGIRVLLVSGSIRVHWKQGCTEMGERRVWCAAVAAAITSRKRRANTGWLGVDEQA